MGQVTAGFQRRGVAFEGRRGHDVLERRHIDRLRDGIERLPDGARKRALETWFGESLLNRFYGRILPIDARVADICGRLMATRARAGFRLGPMDGMLAATALAHDLTIVTRNVSDFDSLGIAVLNPWSKA
jgi:predicted nucleic acid-binding protein